MTEVGYGTRGPPLLNSVLTGGVRKGVEQSLGCAPIVIHTHISVQQQEYSCAMLHLATKNQQAIVDTGSTIDVSVRRIVRTATRAPLHSVRV